MVWPFSKKKPVASTFTVPPELLEAAEDDDVLFDLLTTARKDPDTHPSVPRPALLAVTAQTILRLVAEPQDGDSDPETELTALFITFAASSELGDIYTERVQRVSDEELPANPARITVGKDFSRLLREPPPPPGGLLDAYRQQLALAVAELDAATLLNVYSVDEGDHYVEPPDVQNNRRLFLALFIHLAGYADEACAIAATD